MNGWINDARSRPPDRWKLILDLGPSGNGKRRQKWVTVRGSRDDAKRRLRELLGQHDRGEFVEPSRRLLSDWLDTWLSTIVKPAADRGVQARRTYTTYESAVRLHLRPGLGHLRLQQLEPSHLRRYLAELRCAPASQNLHMAVLSSALDAAVQDRLVQRNVAKLVRWPSPMAAAQGALKAWTSSEARSFLTAAVDAGPLEAAFFALALDSGARKAELQGLRWSDLDLDRRSMRIEQQFYGMGPDGQPVFTRTKTRRVRELELSAETAALLKQWRRSQSEAMLKAGLGRAELVFTQEDGSPLRSATILQSMTALCAVAGVRRITVHGMRHSSATLLLAAGVPPHVVQRRLGHRNISTTLSVYAHILPSQQGEAAAKLAGLLWS